jgi:hypothetical protein
VRLPTYHNLTNEGVPTPAIYLVTRSMYGFAEAAGLRKAGLPHQAYEWNAGLQRVRLAPVARAEGFGFLRSHKSEKVHFAG